MTRSTDNRWSRGSSGATVPDEAVAAYGARWIDMGAAGADIVHDRQGFAYSDTADRDALIERLVGFAGHKLTDGLARDESTSFAPYWGNDDGRFHVTMRRAGGYVYVDAWLDAEVANA